MISRRVFFELSGGAIGAAIARSLPPALESNASGKPAPIPQQEPHGGTVAAVRAVLQRTLGERANNFDLELIEAENGRHSAHISASGGRVSLRGTSGVALCRAAYTYLRQQCSAMVTWGGRHLDLPAQFPSVAEYSIDCPYRFVQYYNPCTFGYSTAYWDWSRWERELDWMAFHGITMPLAMEGQEAIWQSVWRSFGVTQLELDHFSTGPGHLPWHRMGNINYFDGPLPQGWITKKQALQVRILNRMRSLGMTPVAPAFSGFVPEGFKRSHPDARMFTLLWGTGDYPTMPRESKTFILHPAEKDLYREIGRRFIHQYKKAFGEVRYYLADTFNELAPPVTPATRYDDLAEFGRTVYEGILAGDPNGTWVMQGWLFADDPNFWDNPSIEALLSRVPDERMIVLDYTNDADANAHTRFHGGQWKRHHAFFGKQWVNGMAHTFGGNNNVKGDLALIAAQPFAVLSDPDKGNLVGWSMDPEGIENNEVVYELMTDIGWSRTPIDLDVWIASYCTARYGDDSAEMRNAWQLLTKSAYSAHSWMSKHRWQMRPSLEPSKEYEQRFQYSVDTGPVFQEAVESFLACSDRLIANQFYRNDLIELVSQSVGGSVDHLLAATCKAHQQGRSDKRDEQSRAALAMLLRIDGLMNLRPDRRLETWVGFARSWAVSADEAAYYDQNSRRLITFWGWSELSDYAARVWAGLIRDYYVPRWKLFFAEIEETRTSSLDAWEETWLSSEYRSSEALAVPDLQREARQMLDICKTWNV